MRQCMLLSVVDELTVLDLSCSALLEVSSPPGTAR